VQVSFDFSAYIETETCLQKFVADCNVVQTIALDYIKIATFPECPDSSSRDV